MGGKGADILIGKLENQIAVMMKLNKSLSDRIILEGECYWWRAKDKTWRFKCRGIIEHGVKLGDYCHHCGRKIKIVEVSDE